MVPDDADCEFRRQVEVWSGDSGGGFLGNPHIELSEFWLSGFSQPETSVRDQFPLAMHTTSLADAFCSCEFSVRAGSPGTSSAGGVSHRTAKTLSFRPEGPTHAPCVGPPGLRFLMFADRWLTPPALDLSARRA
jgi:hypothetical protein